MKYQAEIQGTTLHLTKNGEHFSLNNQPLELVIHQNSEGEIALGIRNRVHRIQAISWSEDRQCLQAYVNGKRVTIRICDETDLLLQKMGISTDASRGSGKVKAPMPGLIVKTFVQPGDQVEKGQVLLNFEAMKMENQLKSPISGEVKSLKVQAGEKVEKGLVLVEIG